MVVKPPTKKPSGPSNIRIIITKLKTAIHKNIILKIKGHIIHAWLDAFEDQYLKTFKIISENDVDAKAVIGSVYKRMEEYNYQKDKCVIIVKHVSENKFSVIASQTNEEKEFAEFQKWKKTHKKDKKEEIA